MKKSSIAAINLKFMRIPFFLTVFTAAVFTSTHLCLTLPPIDLSKDIVSTLIKSNNALTLENKSCTGVFSLLSNPQKIPSIKEEDITFPQVTQAIKPENIQTRSPKATHDAKVEISNFTKLSISPEDFLGASPSFLGQDFSVLIMHTHTTESYTPSEKFRYTPTDTDRTTDKNFNMVKVGDEIEKVLKDNGIRVYHDETINDYPSYNGSYNRSGTNISNYINNDPSIKIVLDIHRDAIEGAGGEKIKYTSSVEKETAASVMLVVGSNQSGLKHDNWKENMRFAVQLQKHIESLYPTLCRPINFRSQRFNQQLAPGGIIVEVGTNGNTLDEALLGANYFAKALADFIKTHK